MRIHVLNSNMIFIATFLIHVTIVSYKYICFILKKEKKKQNKTKEEGGQSSNFKKHQEGKELS